MLLWSRWQTSSRGSRGLCCRAEKTTGQRGMLLPHEIAWKDACGLEALTRSHSPALRRRIEFTHRGLHRNSEDERTVKTACLNSDVTLWSLRPFG